MIKFFRKARQKLLTENKINKYLFYAFGEIILVVIGILIALQLNNWNERTKERTEEIRILEKVSSDLKGDVKQLEDHITEARKRQKKIDSIFELLYKDPDPDPMKFLEFNDTAIAVEGHFEVNSSTFDESQSGGSIKFIKNDSLREQIFTYYRLAKRNYDDDNTVLIVYRDIMPLLFKKLLATNEFVLKWKGIESALPEINIAAFGKDQDYVAILLLKEISEKVQIQNWKNFKELATSLEQLIQSVLEEK